MDSEVDPRQALDEMVEHLRDAAAGMGFTLNELESEALDKVCAAASLATISGLMQPFEADAFVSRWIQLNGRKMW